VEGDYYLSKRDAVGIVRDVAGFFIPQRPTVRVFARRMAMHILTRKKKSDVSV
jgi:hypothetical protein